MKTLKQISLLMFICVGILSTSCSKKEETKACDNGSVFFKSTQVDPYKIYIDGVIQGTLNAGNTSSAFSVSPNLSHTLKAQQASGYILTPTVINGTVSFGCGGTTTWSFQITVILLKQRTKAINLRSLFSTSRNVTFLNVSSLFLLMYQRQLRHQ